LLPLGLKQLHLQLGQLREFIQRCDMAQSSSPDENQLATMKEILTHFQHEPLPQVPSLLRLRFYKSSFDMNNNRNIIGTLNKEERMVDDTDSILSSSASEASNILPTSTAALKLVPIKMFNHRGKAISRIAALPDKKAWISCSGKKLNLVTRDGSLINSLKLDAAVNGVACSSNGTMTMVCCNDKTIREISANGKPKVRFKTNEKPLDLCITPESEVVIGFEFVVRKYSLDGVVLCKASVMEMVNKVSINNSSGETAVAMASRLEIFDRNLISKFTIDKSNIEKCNIFHPGDVTFDSNQNLLVIDFITESFILFDGLSGQQLCKKKQNQIAPFSMSLQKGDLLWIGGKSGKIRIVRLLS